MPNPHDNWASFYDFVYETTYGNYYQTFTQNHLAVINDLVSKGTILDYGAGTGRLAIPLTKMGFSVIAVEKSEPMVQVFNENAEMNGLQNIPIFNCAINEYQNGQADLALCLFTVLTYITSDTEMRDALRNISKHLSPNGLFLFDLPGSMFFSNHGVMNINKPGLNRSIQISPLQQPIYSYSESCNGNMNGNAFNYNDSFELRHWSIEEINQILEQEGIKRINRNFPQFQGTGSSYFLYQKD